MFLAATLAAPPAQPQMWIAHNATITSTGTMPGLDQGTVELTLSYDFEQKIAEARGGQARDRHGPEPTGEHWFKDMSIHVLNVTNLNDWVVDPNTSAISNWTSYVTMPAGAGWARKETIYGGGLAPSEGLARPPREFER